MMGRTPSTDSFELWLCSHNPGRTVRSGGRVAWKRSRSKASACSTASPSSAAQRHGGVDLRPPRRQRRQVRRAPARRRAHHARDAGARQRLSRAATASRRPAAPPELRQLIRVAAPPQPASSRSADGRTGPQLPLLRQPAEVPAVRQHLQREGGDRAARRHGARAHPSRARRRCACSTPAWATAPC